jgi:UDP-glucose 4-epimerase
MKILVTGGAGFIASHVVDAYVEQGHEVTVLDDLSTGKRENLNPAANFIEMGITDEGLADLFAKEKFEVVNHHAAQISVPYSVEHPDLDLRSNGFGVLNLLEASVKNDVSRFIFISSGGAIYGEQENLPIKEETLPKPLSPYAAHKLLGESYLYTYGASHALNYVVLRYANVYGPRQSIHAEAGVVAIFCERLIEGKTCKIYRYDDMPQGMIRDYVYVGDLVRANVMALEQGTGETFNLGTSVPTGTLDLYNALAKAIGSDAEVEFGPPRPGDIRRSLLDISKAEKVLGWEPRVDLAEGSKRTMEWYQSGKPR